MINKKRWSLLKWATSAAAVCSITTVSALTTSCATNKNNGDDIKDSNISIKDESPADQILNVNNTTSLELFVDATSSDDEILTYQWYVNKNDDNGWIVIAGAISNKYQITEDELSEVKVETTWKYRVEIALANDPNVKVVSKEYSVNIVPKQNTVIPWVPLEPSKPITPTNTENYDTEEVPTALNFDYDKVNISDLSSAPDLDFLYEDKITGKHERTKVVGYYETDLLKKYGDEGFKYPSYDYNYESGKNKYLTLSTGAQINMMQLVYNETVTNNAGKQVRYSDASWIKEQIEAGTLKAHPAAKTWYEQNVTQDTKSVDKHFTIGAIKTGLYTLGLYAPAGEVITLTFDDETFELIQQRSYSGLKIIINDNYWNNYAEGNTGQISNRYPFVSTTFSMDPTTNSIKFGSPFGGNISISISSFLQDETDIINSSVKSLSFTVSGAVESLNYVHGYTTESDWNRQVQDVLNGAITAPSMSAMYSWSAMNIPFTARNKVAGKDIANIAYPYELFKKWNNFQFLSVYTAKSYSKMVSMKFCNDIWNGAGAWGGNYNVYAPISWAGASFLSGKDNFDIKTSWGLMHELNHTYQQDRTLFKEMYHNKTNQMTMVSLSLISDTGRNRSENNILQEGTTLSNPGWTYLSNSYSNLWKMTETTGGVKEYTVYGGLLFTIGARNYIEYTRWAAVNHRNNASGWTGLKEIQALSKYFKVNLWPAFQSVYSYWHDSWPASYQVATDAEKEIIDGLKSYSAVDFVGNLYAAGNYLYDASTKEYRYTGDVNAPYEISGYQDYVFDFGNYINSSNPNFTWSKIIVDEKSKNGVPLEVDGKKVNYLASQGSYNDDVDEFDVTIVPSDWEGKPDNYIPGYKWKIKVRNEIQNAKINLYTGVTSWSADSSNHADEVKKYLPTKSFYTTSFSDQSKYELTGSNNLLRVSFSFIAPSTGNYIFNSLWNSSIAIYINNQKVYFSNSSTTSQTQVFEKHMIANEVINFDVFVYNKGSSCSFDFEVKSGSKTINLTNNLLGFGAYKAWQSLGSSYTFEMYKNDQRFLYKLRFEDYLSYTQDTNATTLISNSGFIVPDSSLYTLKNISPSGNVNINRLYSLTNPSVEIWTSRTLSFSVDFTNITQVGSLRFGHRTDNHKDYRPTEIKVTGVDADGNTIELYNGEYSSSISSRSSNSTIVNLNYVAKVKSLTIELTNSTEGKKGLVVNWFSYSPEIYVPLNNNIAVDNNYIAKTKGWSFIKNGNNDYGVVSSYGVYSLLTATKYDAIDFNLKNSRGFKLIGSTTANQSVFDIYINDKIYQRNVKVGGTDESNVILFKYLLSSEVDDLRVTIVNKSTNPLIINFIQTYGNNGPVYTSPVIVKR